MKYIFRPSPLTAIFLISFSADSIHTSSVEGLPQPQQLIQAASEISSLAKIRPYILTATVVFHPGTKNQESGHLTIYRDKGFYRSELEIGGYRQLEWTLNGKLRVARSTPYPLPG